MEAAIIWAKEVMSVNPVLGAVVFYLFAVVSAMLAFASSAALVPSANLVWGQAVTFLLLWGGWITGAAISFAIGRLARPLLHWLGYEEVLKKYQQLLSTRMRFWVVLLFCFAVPSEIPGYLFGGIHYPFWKFLVAAAIAEGVYAVGLIVAGESLLSANPLLFLIIICALIVIGAGTSRLLRVIKNRKATGRG